MVLQPPTQYRGEVHGYEVVQLSRAMMHIMIGPRANGRIPCGVVDIPTKVIFILAGLSPREYQSVLRHELGHINGWVHPDVIGRAR